MLPHREERLGGDAEPHTGEEPRGGTRHAGGVVRRRQQISLESLAVEQLQHRGQHLAQPEPRHQGRRPTGGHHVRRLPPPERPPQRPPPALLPRNDGEPLPDNDVRHL